MTVSPAALARLKNLLPKNLAPALLQAVAGGQIEMAHIESTLATVDWQRRRPALKRFLREFLPIEELVPEAYEQWRPVVRDGFEFIVTRMAPARLASKLVEQISFPEGTPLEDRVIAFIRRVPILQKIGQTLARNAELDAGLRARLTMLEDGIHEVDEAEIRAEAEKQLGDRLAKHFVVIEPGIYGEGSVSALLRFSRKMHGEIGPAAGVLKVLKPFIADTFHNDIAQLAQLADYFDANQARFNLGKLNLHAMLNEVRSLYEAEVDFVRERVNLAAATEIYSHVAGIRIPQPIEALSTPRVTAMTEEPGVKVTTAFPGDLPRRRKLARTLVECLVARPLFSTEEVAMFHADPHAGNLRVDESSGDIVLLDWALTASLTVSDRRSMILLMLAFPLRDEGQMLAALSEISELKDEANRRFLKQRIEAFMDALPLGSIPRSGNLGGLVNDLLHAGGRFSGSFLIFRKTLATLGDIVEEIAPGESIERIVLEYAWKNGLVDALAPTGLKPAFKLPLRASDVVQIGISAQSLLPRMWAQSLRGIVRNIGDSHNESKQAGERH